MPAVAVTSDVEKFTDDVPDVSDDLVTVKTKVLVPEFPSGIVTLFIDMEDNSATKIGCQLRPESEALLLVTLVCSLPSGFITYISYPTLIAQSLFVANAILVPSGDQVGLRSL